MVTRALVGLGIAGSMTATNSLVADYFSGDARAKFLGQVTAFTGFAGVIFMPFGGLLASLNWHYAFLSYLPALIFAPLTMFYIYEPEVIRTHESEAIATKMKLKPLSLYIVIAIMLNQLAFMSVPVFIASLSATIGWGRQYPGWLDWCILRSVFVFWRFDLWSD